MWTPDARTGWRQIVVLRSTSGIIANGFRIITGTQTSSVFKCRGNLSVAPFCVLNCQVADSITLSRIRDVYLSMTGDAVFKRIVTTSGYGAASFDFANNKPIELIEGPHLLYLLETHAGIKARIEVHDDWRDPVPDSGEFVSPSEESRPPDRPPSI